MNEQTNAYGVEGSMPANVVADLKKYTVSSDLRAVIEATSARTGITSHVVSGSYVSISPDNGQPIAGFIHRKRMTLAMPPPRAELVASQYGWRVQRKNGVSSYVKIPADGLVTEAQRAVARDLLVEAICWRALGSKPPRRRL